MARFGSRGSGLAGSGWHADRAASLHSRMNTGVRRSLAGVRRAVRGEDREPRLILHLLDHVVDLDVCVAVVAVAGDHAVRLASSKSRRSSSRSRRLSCTHDAREVDPVEVQSLVGGGAT